MPRSFTSSGPDDYSAYVRGGGLYRAGLADVIAGVVNRYTGVRLVASGLVQRKANALDRPGEWMDFPGASARGAHDRGSMAHFNAVLCARAASGPGHPPDIRPGVVSGGRRCTTR